MNNTPLVSIIIPVYNLERYIGNTIQTVIDQSIKDFEVIVIDDGSNDNSLSIINSIRERDSRIKVYHQKNHGQANARNNGVCNALGKFITFVDGDDLLKKNYIKTMLEPMLRDSDLDMVALPHQDASIKDIPNLDVSSKKEKSVNLESDDYLIMALKYNNNLYNVSYASKMYRSAIFKDFKIPEGHYYEDLAGLPNLLKKIHKVLWVNDKQYIYLNDRPLSTVNLINKRKAVDIIWALEYLERILKSSSNDVKRAFQIAIVNNIYVAYVPLKGVPSSLKRIDALINKVSISFVLYTSLHVHVSKKGLLFLIGRKIKNLFKRGHRH